MSSATLSFVLCMYAKRFYTIWSTESLQWTHVCRCFPTYTVEPLHAWGSLMIAPIIFNVQLTIVWGSLGHTDSAHVYVFEQILYK